MDDRAAREALAGIGGVQARLAQTTRYPPWRHAAFGAIMALFVGGIGLPTVLNLAATTLGLAATAVVAQQDRERTGVFVNGFRKGATRWISIALMAALLGLIAVQLHLRFDGGPAMAKAGIAALAFALGTVASVAWWRAYVAQLMRSAR